MNTVLPKCYKAFYANCKNAREFVKLFHQEGRRQYDSQQNIFKFESRIKSFMSISNPAAAGKFYDDNYVIVKSDRYAMRTYVCYLEIQRSRGKEGNAGFASEGHLRFVSVTFGFHCGRWKARYVSEHFHFLKFVMNFLKKVLSQYVTAFEVQVWGFFLQFFLWESLGLLQPKVEGPEVKDGDTTVSIEQQTRTKIKAVCSKINSSEPFGHPNL